MKPNIKNIDEIVKRHLPSASEDRIDAGTTRVLHELRSQPHRVADRTPSQVPTRPLEWKWIALASVAALMLLAVFIGPIVWRQYHAPGVLESADHSRRIGYGEVVRADAGADSTLVLADKSRVEMRAETELLLERAGDGMRIRLNKGDVIVSAAKQSNGHLYVQTRDMTVSVVGTVFFVKAEAEGSRVAVIEGEVRVQRGETENKLRSGEQVATNPRMESQKLNEEISWSKNAVAHIALLQQSSRDITESQEVFEVASIRPKNSPAGGGGRGGAGGAPPACGGSPATIDPGRFVITNATLYRLITMAYGKDCASAEVSEFELLSGGPEWIRSDKFDIEAVIPKGSSSYTRQQLSIGNAPKLQMMIQTLLVDRFKLTVRRSIKEMPVYLLMLGKGAPKLTEWKDADGTAYTVNTGLNPKGEVSTAIGGRKLSMADLAQQLGLITRRPVLDRTGITGEFTYAFEFAPSDDQPGVREMRANGRFPFLSGPSLFTALEEELGLKLETSKAPVEVLVIEHAEKPSEN